MIHWVSDDAKLALGGFLVRIWRHINSILLGEYPPTSTLEELKTCRRCHHPWHRHDVPYTHTETINAPPSCADCRELLDALPNIEELNP